MLFKEIIAVYSANHTKHTNILCGHNVELLIIKKQKVKQSRYTPWRRLGGEEV
jgi:hypothetical protein